MATFTIAADADDGYSEALQEFITPAASTYANFYLGHGFPNVGDNVEAGWIFRGTGIPQGATILSAFLTLQFNPSDYAPTPTGSIYGYAVDTPTAFSAAHTTHRLSDHHTRTTSFVAVSIPQATTWNSPSLVTVIQELVSRTTFLGHLGLCYRDTTSAYCWARVLDYGDAPASAATLTVTWSGAATTFPTTGTLDTFNRANETLNTGNWSAGDTATTLPLQLLSNQATGTVQGAWNTSVWTAQVLGPDCEVWVDIPAVHTGDGHEIDLGFRSDAGLNSYCLAIFITGGVWQWGFYAQIQNVWTQLGALLSTQALAAGDAIGVRAIGSNLEAFWKPAAGVWQSMGVRQDSTWTAPGYLYLSVGYNQTVTRFDNFSGGSLNSNFVRIVGDRLQVALTEASTRSDVSATILKTVSDTLALALTEAVTMTKTSLAFPSTIVLDDFNRANQGPPPSASWVTAGGSGWLVSNLQARPITTTAEHATTWNTIFPSNQEVFVQIGTQLPNPGLLGFALIARLATPTNIASDHYELRVLMGSSAVSPSGGKTRLHPGVLIGRRYGDFTKIRTATLQVWKHVSGVDTQLGADIAMPSANTGDHIGMRVEGTTIGVWHQNLELTTRTDSSIPSAGYIGLRNGLNFGTAAIDNFGGGQVQAPLATKSATDTLSVKTTEGLPTIANRLATMDLLMVRLLDASTPTVTKTTNLTFAVPVAHPTWAPTWLITVDQSIRDWVQEDLFQSNMVSHGVVSTSGQVTQYGLLRIAMRDLSVSGSLYHGILCEEPTIMKEYIDTFWGWTEVGSVSLSVANTNGILNELFALDMRGLPLTIARYDTATGESLTDFHGMITGAQLNIGTLSLTASELDFSLFETLIPRGVTDTAVFGTRLVDVGLPIPVIFGVVGTHPLLYVNDGVSGNTYDYLVGRGALSIVAVYRDGGNDTLHLVNPAEYTVETDRYAGMTTIRFPVRQVNFQNAFHKLFADVIGLQPERNFARAIRTLLSDTTYGLGQTIDSTSFDQAETDLVPVGLLCDGSMTTPRPAQDILRDLMQVRGMRLGRTSAGAWTLSVDKFSGTLQLALRDGTGTGERNILSISALQKASAENSIRSLVVQYRLESTNDRHLEARRTIRTTFGHDQVITCPFVRDPTTADKIAHYLAQREILGSDTLQVAIGQEGRALQPGHLLSVTYAPLALTDQVMEIRQIEKRIEGVSLSLGTWSQEFYTYLPSGDLSVAPESIAIEEVQRDAPATPAGLTVTAGIEYTGDGSTVAVIDASWPANHESDLRGYELTYRQTASAGQVQDSPFTTIATDRDATSLRLTVWGNATFEVKLRAADIFGNVSAYTASEFVTTPIDASGPTGTPVVLVRQSGSKVVEIEADFAEPLDWGTTRLYRSTVDQFGTALEISSGKTHTFHDVNVDYDAEYYYWVRIVDLSGNIGTVSPSVNHHVLVARLGRDDLSPGALSQQTQQVDQPGGSLTSTNYVTLLSQVVDSAAGQANTILARGFTRTATQAYNMRLIRTNSTGGGITEIDFLTSSTGLGPQTLIALDIPDANSSGTFIYVFQARVIP